VRYIYPQNIILDLKSTNLTYSNDYWVLRYSESFTANGYFYNTLLIPTNTRYSNQSLITNNVKSTATFNSLGNFWSKLEKGVGEDTRARKIKTSKRKYLKESKDSLILPNFKKNLNYYVNNNTSDKTLSQTPLTLILKREGFEDPEKTSFSITRTLTNNLFDINFIKKERLYTKLKYSRSPAYDIVSGGSAALLAGFIGFLVSEKFGIELVDSGDFYIVFMYAVFISLSCRPLLKIISSSEKTWSIFSVNFFIDYYMFVVSSYISIFKKLMSPLYDFYKKTQTDLSTSLLIFIILCFLL